MGDEDNFTLEQVAERVGVHYQTVYRWVRAGRLPATKVGGSYVVQSKALSDFMQRRERPAAPPRPARARIDRQRVAMRDALWNGHEAKARSIARGLVSNGTPVTALIEGVIVPPLQEIGAAWSAGELAIFVEHRASAIVERLLGDVAPNPRGRRRGRAMVAAVTGDLHSLPTTMATAALREDNWHVEHLGADVPPTELQLFAPTHDISLAVITSTIPNEMLVEQARVGLAQEAGIPTIVGRPGATLTELQRSARSIVQSTG